MIFPAAAALMFIVLPWRQALMILGALGSVAAVAIFVAMPRFSDARYRRERTKVPEVSPVPQGLLHFRCSCRLA